MAKNSQASSIKWHLIHFVQLTCREVIIIYLQHNPNNHPVKEKPLLYAIYTYNIIKNTYILICICKYISVYTMK